MRDPKRTGFIAAFLAPAVALYAMFVVYPLFQTFQLSFFRYKGLSSNKEFKGVANYEWLAKTDVFWTTLKNNLFLLVVGGLAILALSIMIAHVMRGKGKAIGVMRGIFLFPQVISLVVVAVIWQFMYNPNHGLVNATLSGFGLGQFNATWLANKSTALPAVTIAFVWWALGFYVMLFTAGLQAIPEEVQEAAELDGAHGLRRFWQITWPMLWSIRKIASIYILTNVLNVFVLVNVMTNGGPDKATETMLTNLFQVGFVESHYGRASALAATNFVIALVLAGILFLAFRRNPEASR